MKRFVIVTLIAFGALFGTVMPSQAMEHLCAAGIPSVRVMEGETLWGYNPDGWRALTALNPSLDQSWRKFTTAAGGPGVRLVIGETICGVSRNGVGDIVSAEDTVPSTVMPFIKAHPVSSSVGGLLSLLILAFLVLCAWVAFQRRKDPVTSGYPVVPSGVQGVEAASARFSVDVANRHPGRPFHILDVVEGTGTGDMMVAYGNGQQPQPRRMNNERIYRARVQFTDQQGGGEEVLMLEHCGNDLRRHNGLLRYVPAAGFVFSPNHVAQPVTAESEPLVAEVIPQPVAANQAEPEVEEVIQAASTTAFSAVRNPDGTAAIAVDLSQFDNFEMTPDGKVTFTVVKPTSQVGVSEASAKNIATAA